MNWGALGAIGEVFGAIAVVITLIYLSKQLREHTKSLHIQSLNVSFEEYNSLVGELQALDGIGTAYRKNLLGEELTPEEEYELRYFFVRVFNINEKLLYLHSKGAADSFNQGKFERVIQPVLETTYIKQWWPANRYRYSDEFVEYIEKLIENQKSAHEKQKFESRDNET